MHAPHPLAEQETLEQLLAEEAVLDRALDEARREAAQLLDDTRAETERLRHQAGIALEQELHELREQAARERDLRLEEVRAETARRAAELRRRAARNRDRALAVLLVPVTGGPGP